MIEDENPIREALASFDQDRAKIAYQTLLGLLHAVRAEEGAPTLAILRENPELHIALLSKHPLMCNTIMDLSHLAITVIEQNIPVTDFVVAHDIAALVQVLTLSYESHGASEETLEMMDAAYPPLFRRFLDGASSQVTTLCTYMLSIRDFLSKLALAQSRVVLVELPIGNSLPVSILNNLLSPVRPPELVRVSLSRNDKARVGVTRRELLEERLQTIGLTAKDIVLYLDEWNSGVNFNILCELQAKILGGSGAFLLPCAMLSYRASSEPRYAKFCSQHDDHLRAWGRRGEEFRQEFPQLVSALPFEGEFFWSEKDRVAGWRKLQLHGAMFSSIDATIDLLTKNAEQLDAALQLVIVEIASTKELPSSPAQSLKTMREMFFESCEAYSQRRDELIRCADELAAGGMVDDFDSALHDLHDIYEKAGIEKGKEKMATCVALMFMKRMGSFDPADRYYFKTHAPIVVPLRGRMSRTNQLAIDYIEERLRVLGH